MGGICLNPGEVGINCAVGELRVGMDIKPGTSSVLKLLHGWGPPHTFRTREYIVVEQSYCHSKNCTESYDYTIGIGRFQEEHINASGILFFPRFIASDVQLSSKRICRLFYTGSP